MSVVAYLIVLLIACLLIFVGKKLDIVYDFIMCAVSFFGCGSILFFISYFCWGVPDTFAVFLGFGPPLATLVIMNI